VREVRESGVGHADADDADAMQDEPPSEHSGAEVDKATSTMIAAAISSACSMR
jgi:hypothetical protein